MNQKYQEATTRQIRQKWGTSAIWNIYDPKDSNYHNNRSGFQPTSNSPWSNISQKTSSVEGFVHGNLWGSLSAWNNHSYIRPMNGSYWAHPNQSSTAINSQTQEPNHQQSQRNKSASIVKPEVKILSSPQDRFHGISSSCPRGFIYKPIPNNSWSQLPQQDLKGGEYFDYLKKNGIDDEVICLLSSQGIDSLELLRECTQEALVGIGIKLYQVLRLKKL